MALPCLGLGLGVIRWVIPSQEGIHGPTDQFRHCHSFSLRPLSQPFKLLVSDIDIGSFHDAFLLTYANYPCILRIAKKTRKDKRMLIYEYKLVGNKAQYGAIDQAIRLTQFIRNKCLALWMSTRGISKNDLQCYCAVLAKEFPFAARLNSQARQAAADRAWFAISRFYDNCKTHKPGKKGSPRFQHDTRSVEYKPTGWKLEPDGKHITFTDGCGIGRLRLLERRSSNGEKN
jgi:hypothetical protein